MARIESPVHLAALSLGVSLGLALHPSLLTQAQSQPAVRAQMIPTVVEFKPPKDEGAPKETAAGGTRGGCLLQPLVALIPAADFGLTVSEHPTLLFYMPAYDPELVPPSKIAEFHLNKTKGNLEDGNISEEEIYKTTFTITGTPGIISVTLPASLPPLEIDEWYGWDLSVICNAEDREGNPMVQGWLKRKEPTPTLVRLLREASPLQRAALYANEGIWHDSLATLAMAWRSQPNDPQLAAAWGKLLKSIELTKSLPDGDKRLNQDQLAKAPLSECCTIEK